MSWLITGAGGMLARDLAGRLEARGVDVVALGHRELDICDAGAVMRVVRDHRGATVVNCAAWTAVDDAEEQEAAALAVNGTAVETLAVVCAETASPLIHVSTDYVLDGSGDLPHPEDAKPSPVNAYGRTKLAGEQAVLDRGAGHVVRTGWLYGRYGSNFVRTMARLAGERDTVDVVDDQYGQPTWTGDLAEQIIALAGSGAPRGVYHGTSAGRTTWYGLAREIFILLGLDPARVRPTTSERFVRPAARPANSVLGHAAWAAAGLTPMRDWRAALHAAWTSELSAAWAEPRARGELSGPSRS